MNYYSYLHATRNASALSQVQDAGLFEESKVRRVSKGSKGGGQFAEKPETKAKKDQADLLDKGESFMDTFGKKAKNDRIYAVSDIHHSGIDGITDKDCGTIVIAGDFMAKGKKKEDIKEAEKWWKEKFLPWCEEHKDQNIVIIGGNCDKWLYYNRDKLEWPKNVHYLDDSAAEVNGMKVYGTSWCPHNMNGAWEVSEEEMEKEFSKIPYGLDILVTHAPPKGEGLDLDHDTTFNNHFGSEALTKAILEKKPKIVLCGHVHSGSHKPVKIGDSIVMNVSRIDDDRYEQSFHGRRIGVERTDNGLGFLVDMDYDGKMPLGKKEDVPEDIIAMRDALRRVANSIQKNIGKKGDGPDKDLVEKANKAIDKAKDSLNSFDHPRRKMLEESIKAFHESEKNGFSKPMPRVGRLYDGDKNKDPIKYGDLFGGSTMPYGGHSDSFKGYSSIPHWWGYGGGDHIDAGHSPGHGGGYFGGHYSESVHKPHTSNKSDSHSGMSIADIMAGKGMTKNYWGDLGGKNKKKSEHKMPEDDNPFDEFGLPK